MDLTADEAVARALERNLTLASQRLTPQTFDYSLAATRAFYRPNVTSQVSNNSADQLGRLTTDGGLKTNQDTAGWNAGLTQNMPKFGGNYQAELDEQPPVDRRRTTAQFLTPPTRLASRRSLHPAPAGEPQDRQHPDDAPDHRHPAGPWPSSICSPRPQARWRRCGTPTGSSCSAILNLENQRAALDLSSKLVQDNRARVEIGTMAPIDIVQAQAEEATRRQTVVNAEATLQNTELALKRLIVSGTDDPLWTASINATDRPALGRPKRSTSRPPCGTR